MENKDDELQVAFCIYKEQNLRDLDFCYEGGPKDAAHCAKTFYNELHRTDNVLTSMWDDLDFFWRWIERAYFDKSLGVEECLGVLCHSPSAPWNKDRKLWDTKHKDYDSRINEAIIKSKEINYEEIGPEIEDLQKELKRLKNAIRGMYAEKHRKKAG